MQSYLKEFRLPLDKDQQAIPQNQSFQNDRCNSSNCYSSQSKKRTIQEILKQQIHHNRAFKSVLNSINSSPLRENLCSSPKYHNKQTNFNKNFVQECQSPSATKKMFLIVTDFNNKHYKIVSTTTKDETLERRNTQQSTPSTQDKGVLLSNLKLKQAFIGNIQFPQDEDKINHITENEKLRPMTMMSLSDKKKGGTFYNNNSPPLSRKYKLNSTFRDTNSRLNQSMNDNFLTNQIKFQQNCSNSLLNSAMSSHQFPANMPVKTRKNKLKKEDLVDKILQEQRKKDYYDTKEKVRSLTQYTQNDQHSIQNGDYYLDNIIHSQSTNHNVNSPYEIQDLIQYNPIICKGTRPFSNQSSPLTKKERYQKIMNKSVLLSNDKSKYSNELNSSRGVSRERINSNQVQSKVLQNQNMITPEKIKLPQNYPEQDTIDKKEHKKVCIDLKGRYIRANSSNKDQEERLQTPIQSNYQERNLSSSNQYNDQYPNYLRSLNTNSNSIPNVEPILQEFNVSLSQQNRIQPLSKQEQVKYKFYNQFYKQPQIQRLFNEFENQEIEKQEVLKSNSSSNNQYNYFSYNKTFN